jgi:uroporphyrinogen decarboxylase
MTPTPRERVLTALNHQRPDRTPCDFWAEECTWNRLLAHAGHQDRGRLLDELGVDVRHLAAGGLGERELGGGVWQNAWGERYVYRQTPWGPMRDDLPGALSAAQSLADLVNFDWPSPDRIDYSGLAAQCRRLDAHALLYGFADVWQRPALVRGWEGMFLDMVDRPEWVHFLCRKFTDFYLTDYAQVAAATDGRIDLYLLISDLGSQNGPLISVAMFRQFLAPYVQEMVDRIHELGGKVLFHSCGAIAPFIPDLIALGVDALDPIQPVGPAMSPERLQADFGGRLCFHGGIDMQRLLPHGTPAEVRAEAERYCRTLGRRGGYILGPAHLFQPDVPPENVYALYEADRRAE